MSFQPSQISLNIKFTCTNTTVTLHYNCALSARPSLSADLSPCTGCYKLILLTFYGGPAAAVR